jgi:D-alanyl-lipoteichoic acid acyltransferase DltB (MBOAT superfamily)
MLFNSIDFAVFFPIVFALYWATAKNVKIQNALLLIASYFFYCWWDWRYLSLVILCSATNYVGGLWMMKTEDPQRRKSILVACCVISLGVLGIFKYYNFFLTAFVDAFSLVGVRLPAQTLKLILPVGISFYTFHTLSYTIDVYRKKFEPTRDILSFFLFVSIFPLAMAGPIERATNLLPQIYKRRIFEHTVAVDGLRQVLWGLFKKMVIADNCAEFADLFFNHSSDYPGSALALGAIFFAFQIYGDFSGYSDMAIGLGKLLGFRFLHNFSYPYFSRDIAEFWRRWHISLTTWFRDYLYIPLGGSRGGKWKTIRNTFIIFIVSGFWHGADWTFITWGALNAVYFLPLLLTKNNRKNLDIVAKGRKLPTLKVLLSMLFTFSITTFAWIFFRAENMGHAWAYISEIFSPSLFVSPDFWKKKAILIACLIVLFMVIEWIGREKEYAIAAIGSKWKRPYRWVFYCILIFFIFVFYVEEKQAFIYFQF